MSRFASSKNRGRGSSPHDNDFHTATETFDPLHLIHSTPQRAADEHAFPLHYDEHSAMYDQRDQDTQGSADMSIELGRGGPHAVELDDMSSNAVFSIGLENSQQEAAGTPLARARHAQLRSGGPLRKQASLQRATESAALRTNGNVPKRVFSETAADTNGKQEEEPVQQATATLTIRGSRFAGIRQISSQYNLPKRFAADGGFSSANLTPRRAAVGNATVQSATYTAGHSFMLPDLPNITELVSGIRKDSTPSAKRTAATRSRFQSNTQTHIPVGAAAVPEDERDILASIQELSNRVAQLEREKLQAQTHLEQYEEQVIELRAQLDVATRRPDSGLGFEEDTRDAVQVPRGEKQRLQAKIKAGEERLQRSERKANISDIAVTRVTRERDHLITQLASAYYKIEELEKENEDFRKSYNSLKGENEDLGDRMQKLQEHNMALDEENHRISTATGADPSKRRRSASRTGSKRRETAAREQDGVEQLPLGDDEAHDKLASEIQRRVQKHREAALAETRSSQHRRRSSTLRSLSALQSRASSVPERNERRASAPAGLDPSEAEQTARSGYSGLSRRATKHAQQFEDDLTLLSDIDVADVANLRKKLEEELRAKHAQKQGVCKEGESTATQQAVTRKSSLKDVTAGAYEGTGRLSLAGTLDDIVQGTKTVRVQSPHTADEISHCGDQQTETGDISIFSNTSRRRRRAASAEAMTSAFIIPDITMHKTRASKTTSIQHDLASCTACPHGTNKVVIPTPIAVTARRGYLDLTDATIRPSQPPAIALATVIKHLEDEIKHLKIRRESQNRLYTQHDPALSKRRRIEVKNRIEALTAEIEKRSDQVYALYDVVEGQKQQDGNKQMGEDEVEETLQSLDIDPVELSGRVGRKAPAGLEDVSDESELQFEGFSDVESEEDGEVRV